MLMPWAAGLPGTPWTELPARQDLQFKLGAFDPLLDVIPAGGRLAALDGEGPFVVQFPGEAHSAQALAIERAGGTVVGHLGHGGFVAVGAAGLGAALKGIDGVRWVGRVPPSLRLDPAASGAGTVELSYGGAPGVLMEELRSVSATALALGAVSAVVRPGQGGAAALASLPHVLFVSPYTPPAPSNFRAVVTDGIRQPANASAYTSAGGGLWTFNGNPGDPRFLGYTGAGVTVDVTDEGVDTSHPAFAGRLGTSTTWSGVPAGQDFTGHGTHVAASALGDGSYFAADGPLAPGLYAGAAPGATLVAQNYDLTAMNYSALAEFAATAGATISVNSWGNGSGPALGAYTPAAAEYDNLTRDASPSTVGDQPLLFVFAAGNEMNAPGSIDSPATAKNVLTVGATGNDYPGLSTSLQVALFSSFGYTDDGRVKPDLVAPGEMVASARSSMGPGGTGVLPPYAGTSYAYRNGTSMAGPQVAGAAAVATQYLRDARQVVATPALLKALLINGAEPLPGVAWPGPEQGWGRLNLSASLFGAGASRVDFVQEGFRTFQGDGLTDFVQFSVALDAGSQFRVSLVWTDHENSPLASPALWNDLDLEVRDPTGALVYLGNRINATTGYSEDVMPGHFDGVNNVEAVRIASAAAGNWSIFVRSNKWDSFAQTFALAYSGAINQSQPDLSVQSLALEGAPGRIDSGGTVTLDGDAANHGGSAAMGVVVEAFDANDALAPAYASANLGTLAPGGRAPFSLPFQPPDGDNSVEVRVRFGGTDGDPADNKAPVAFFVTRIQPQLGGAAEAIAQPGEAATFALTATNRGNIADTLLLTEAPGVRDPTWPLSLSATVFTLGPGQSAPFEANITVPANASLGASALAELWLTSSQNTSRVDALSITARAGATHALALSSSTPALAPAPNSSISFRLHVTNLGNTPEDVTVALTPLWVSAFADWMVAWTLVGGNATVARGDGVDLDLYANNTDRGDAGYRGELQVRATLASTGATFDLLLPVFVQAQPCLAFGKAADASSVVGTTTHPALSLENCGNTRLAGNLSYAAEDGLRFEGPPWYDLFPGRQEYLSTDLTAEPFLEERSYTLHVTAETGGGQRATVSFVVRHRSAVDLVEDGPDAVFFAEGSFLTAHVTFRNRGGAGPVAAPLVVGLPPGWRATVFPALIQAGEGENVSFDILVEVPPGESSRVVPLTLVFYPGSSREGAFSPTVTVRWEPPSEPPHPANPAWPSSLVAAGAVLFGTLCAAVAAFVLSRSRGLKRACPACGRKAPRFDTLLNPRCSHCGEGLLGSPPT